MATTKIKNIEGKTNNHNLFLKRVMWASKCDQMGGEARKWESRLSLTSTNVHLTLSNNPDP